MNSLDLKFIIHHGDYIVQNVMGIYELVGSDVNLAHRLMKNHISQATGWHAYTLLTQKSLDHLGVRPSHLHEQIESYEHLGETKTYSYDLQSIYRAHNDTLRIVVTPEEAVVKLEHDFAATPTVLWDWLNDPSKRAQYTMQDGLEFRTVFLPNGRRGVGAKTHCMHGQDAAMREVVLDWKPFEYFTVEQDGGRMFGRITATYHLASTQNGNATHLTICIKGRIGPGILNNPLLKLAYGKMFMPALIKNLDNRLSEQQAVTTLDSSPELHSEPQPDTLP